MVGYLTVAHDVPNEVQLNPIAPAGFRILEACSSVARAMGFVVEITCGSNSHPASDPHTLGMAYDIRSHKMSLLQKQMFLRGVMDNLAYSTSDLAISTDGGLATTYFFGFLEDPGTPNEHFHIQRRKSAVWPPVEKAITA